MTMNISMIRISDPDTAPEWLSEAMPLEMKALRQFESDDGSQYILTEILTPIDGPNGEVSHLVVGGRMVGAPLTGGVGGTPANVAYVSDQSLLEDKKIDFDKAEFSAITLASCIPQLARTSKPSLKKWWQFWK